MQESRYQNQLIKKLKSLFPDCIVMKNDAGYIQGIPDLTILYKDRWAMLEVKASATANVQPNQAYYVEQTGAMSFAAFIYPENEREVLHELQLAFQSDRKARIS